MAELIKPTKKGKNDGVVDYLTSDDCRFLVMAGDYSEVDIIRAAVHQNVIGADDAKDWITGERSRVRYYQSWYKVSPVGGQEGYSNWHHPRDTPCRGAYFASTLCWD